jgi:hypothetical protein
MPSGREVISKERDLSSKKMEAMNELNLYAIFKSILQKSKVIEGRFTVCTGYGNDLNLNNLGEIVKDALGGITTLKKYPACIMMPPYEMMGDTYKNWSLFKVKLFFCVPQFSNHGIKNPNSFNNTSEHNIQQDWKDMRECAGDFRKFTEEIFYQKELLNKIRIPDNSIDYYERYSQVGNDKLSVVSLSFDIEIFNSCELKDYDLNDISIINLDLSEIHPLHKH